MLAANWCDVTFSGYLYFSSFLAANKLCCGVRRSRALDSPQRCFAVSLDGNRPETYALYHLDSKCSIWTSVDVSIRFSFWQSYFANGHESEVVHLYGWILICRASWWGQNINNFTVMALWQLESRCWKHFSQVSESEPYYMWFPLFCLDKFRPSLYTVYFHCSVYWCHQCGN